MGQVGEMTRQVLPRAGLSCRHGDYRRTWGPAVDGAGAGLAGPTGIEGGRAAAAVTAGTAEGTRASRSCPASSSSSSRVMGKGGGGVERLVVVGGGMVRGAAAARVSDERDVAARWDGGSGGAMVDERRALVVMEGVEVRVWR